MRIITPADNFYHHQNPFFEQVKTLDAASYRINRQKQRRFQGHRPSRGSRKVPYTQYFSPTKTPPLPKKRIDLQLCGRNMYYPPSGLFPIYLAGGNKPGGGIVFVCTVFLSTRVTLSKIGKYRASCNITVT